MKITKHIYYYILGGVSFEVVDASIVSKTEEGVEDSQKDAFVSADFIPAKTLRRLNSRRGVSNQNCLWIGVDFQDFIPKTVSVWKTPLTLFGALFPLLAYNSLWVLQKSQKLFRFFTRMGKNLAKFCIGKQNSIILML